MSEIKKDCENYIQHYAYSQNMKRVIIIHCGHCIACKKLDCMNCAFYQPKKSNEEEFWMTINSKIDVQIKELRLLQSSLSKNNLKEVA